VNSLTAILIFAWQEVQQQRALAAESAREAESSKGREVARLEAEMQLQEARYTLAPWKSGVTGDFLQVALLLLSVWQACLWQADCLGSSFSDLCLYCPLPQTQKQ